MLLILIPVIYYMANTLDFSRVLNLSTDTGVKSRITVLDESIQVINNSPIIGNGFGTELPSKKQHQENSFLDIFVEQGLIGLFCYLLVFYFCLVNFKAYTALKVALISIAFMSMTNPYINNPIGIGLIILVLTLNSSYINSSQGRKNDCGNICNV